MSEYEECTCVPQVFACWHRGELLVAWFWPDGPMWLQQEGCVPIEVTSDEFAVRVELGWTQMLVEPGTTEVQVETPTGPAYFELVR